VTTKRRNQWEHNKERTQNMRKDNVRLGSTAANRTVTAKLILKGYTNYYLIARIY